MKHSYLQYFVLIILCFLGRNTHCQNFSFTQFENEKDSILRYEMGIESWNYYVKSNLDSLRILGTQMTNNDISIMRALGLRNLGSFNVRGSDIEKGIGLLLDAKEVFSREGKLMLLSETENELGNAHFLLGDYGQAANHYLASISRGLRSSDNTAGYNGMIGLGKTLVNAGDTTQGLRFIQGFLEKCLNDGKYESAADACGILGMIAGNQGRIELMSAYYRRGNLYSSRSSSSAYHANALTNKAIDYFYHDKVDSSILLFQESLKIREEVGATRPIVESLYNLAIFHIELAELPEAKKYAERGEALSSEKGIRSWQLDCLKLILEIAEKSGDLSNVESIKFDIERIKKELEEMSTLDDEIIDLAVQLTSIDDRVPENDYLWEIISAVLILLSSGLLLYSYRFNSASVGTQA